MEESGQSTHTNGQTNRSVSKSQLGAGVCQATTAMTHLVRTGSNGKRICKLIKLSFTQRTKLNRLQFPLAFNVSRVEECKRKLIKNGQTNLENVKQQDAVPAPVEQVEKERIFGLQNF